MDESTHQRWIMWGKGALLLVCCLLGFALFALPARAAELPSINGTAIGVSRTDAAATSTRQVDIIIGARVGDPVARVDDSAGFGSPVHPMLLVLGGLLMAFAVAIGLLLAAPAYRRKARGLQANQGGLDYRHLRLETHGQSVGLRYLGS